MSKELIFLQLVLLDSYVDPRSPWETCENFDSNSFSIKTYICIAHLTLKYCGHFSFLEVRVFLWWCMHSRTGFLLCLHVPLCISIFGINMS